MALTPKPKLVASDQFLLNRTGTSGGTFKIPFSALADNVLNIIIDPNGNGTGNQLELNLNKDISTDIYVSAFDSKKHPSVTSKFAAGDDINTSGKFWMLQWMSTNSSVTGDHDTTNGEFVLRDPDELFTVFQGNISDAINALELNSLNDVKTRVDADNDDSEYLEHVAGDSFLLCTVADSVNGGTAALPQFSVKRLSETIQGKINNQDITIDLDKIIDVNPIQGGGSALGRLKINTVGGWYPGADELPDANFIPKYEIVSDPDPEPVYDDILVYIADPTKEISGTTAADSVSGWYYAEAQFGDELGIAGVSPSAEDSVGVTVDLGGVRILQYKNTTLVGNGKGGLEIGAVDANPVRTNIGITSQGVLYSEIPNTLTFRQVIDIYPDETEYFGGTSDLVLAATATIPGGPAAAETPLDPNTSPAVGDFYVIRMAEKAAPGGNAATPLTSKRLEWRSFDGSTTITNDGSKPIVENGDIVVWSGRSWVVIGTVNTDSIAQDLQSVTDRGNTTTNAIVIGLNAVPTGVGAGMLYVKGVNDLETNGREKYVPAEGDIAGKRLSVTEIDFDAIELLPETP